MSSVFRSSRKGVKTQTSAFYKGRKKSVIPGESV